MLLSWFSAVRCNKLEQCCIDILGEDIARLQYSSQLWYITDPLGNFVGGEAELKLGLVFSPAMVKLLC